MFKNVEELRNALTENDVADTIISNAGLSKTLNPLINRNTFIGINIEEVRTKNCFIASITYKNNKQKYYIFSVEKNNTDEDEYLYVSKLLKKRKKAKIGNQFIDSFEYEVSGAPDVYEIPKKVTRKRFHL